MAAWNPPLPKELRAVLDEHLSERLSAPRSERSKDPIGRTGDALRLRDAVIHGIRSGQGEEMDAAYFDRLRTRATR